MHACLLGHIGSHSCSFDARWNDRKEGGDDLCNSALEARYTIFSILHTNRHAFPFHGTNQGSPNLMRPHIRQDGSTRKQTLPATATRTAMATERERERTGTNRNEQEPQPQHTTFSSESRCSLCSIKLKDDTYQLVKTCLIARPHEIPHVHIIRGGRRVFKSCVF